MSGAFKPKVEAHSTLSGHQQFLEGKTGNLIYNMLMGGGGLQNQMMGMLSQSQDMTQGPLKQLLSGKPTGVGDYFRKGVLDPMLRSFDRDIAPRIDESFARHGASFGSRRGTATAQSLSDLHAAAGGQLAQMRTQMAESAKARQLAAVGIPLQQTLGQIGGMMNIQQMGIPAALQFLQRQSTGLSSTPGWGSQALQLGGTLGGAALGGPFGAAVGGGLGSVLGKGGGGGGGGTPIPGMMNVNW